MTSLTRAQRWLDAAVAALVVAGGLAEVLVPMDSVMGGGSPAVSVLGILLVGALLTQRRARPWTSVAALAVWPVLGVLTAGNLQILFLGQLIPFVVLVYSLARHAPGRLRWMGALAAAAVLLMADLFIADLQTPGEVLFHWGMVTVAYAAGHGLRAAEERAAASAVRALRAEGAARERAAAAVAEERARIARELHDIVAHSLSVIVVQAGAAEQVVEDDPDVARRALTAIRSTGTGALAELRRLVTVLRAPETAELTPQPGVDSLPALVEAARATGLEVELALRGDRRQLPAGLELTAYRIVQEALTNVRRHSTAPRAQVAVDFTTEGLEITVHDDGPAREVDGEPGYGLVGMQERAKLFGGRLETANGSGFTVRAVLPLEAL